MRINFIVLCSGSYWMGFAALVESILRNGCLDINNYNFQVYTNDSVPDFVQKWIDNREEKILISSASVLDRVKPRVTQEQQRLTEALRKITLLGEHNKTIEARHILIDADMICIGSIEQLLEFNGFHSAPNSLEKFITVNQDNRANSTEINSGFMAFKPSNTICDDLIRIYNAHPQRYTKAADQDVFNEWQRQSGMIQLIGSEWNCLKTVYAKLNKKSEYNQILKKTKILHYILDKPWELPSNPAKLSLQRSQFKLERLWWRYYLTAGMHDPEKYWSRSWLHPFRRLFASWKQSKINRFKTKFRRGLKRLIKPLLKQQIIINLLKSVVDIIRRLMQLDRISVQDNSNVHDPKNSTAHQLFVDQTVLNGPFKGLNYPSLETTRNVLWPKLLGSYALELAPTIEAWKDCNFDTIIDVGCAEGYFAVGLALRWKCANVYAYDTNPAARDLCRKMTLANCLEDRISVRECFKSEQFAYLTTDKNILFFCDVDGAECEVVSDFLQIKAVKSAFLIIETHDFEGIDRTQKVLDILQPTHVTKVIQGIDDYRRPLVYEFKELKGLSFDIKKSLLAEHRPHSQNWIIAEPKI